MSTTTTITQGSTFDIASLSADEKKELFTSETASICSGTTLGNPSSPFIPIKSLHINAKGIPVLRLPLPSRELVTSICNPDGTLAYTSTRAKRSSGNCILTNAEGKELIKTTYWFGPGKDPTLQRVHVSSPSADVELSSKTITIDGAEEIKTLSKWTSRNHTFVLPSGRTFSWVYKREKGFGKDGEKGTALVLMVDERRIAVFIRNEETRTPGSKSSSAGNGGELVLSADVNGDDGIDEGVVVATCLMMLKKEIDRRRAVQFMMIGAAASS